jgi:tripartite-type tricarboxylate transporter receptor subunit TctC
VICLLLPATAAAEDFPTKPIRLIVPFPPGGPNDIIVRVIGRRMSGAGTHLSLRTQILRAVGAAIE